MVARARNRVHPARVPAARDTVEVIQSVIDKGAGKGALIYVQRRISDATRLQEDLRQLGIEFEEYNVCPAHSGTPGCIGIGMSIHADGRVETVRKLRELDYIIYAVTAN